MKIVLLKSVDNLGTAGDAVNVKRGYFRNYLEPRRMALLATKDNVAFVETQREKLQAVVARETADATTLKEKIEALSLTFQLRAGDSGRLFGSVTAKEVLARINEETGLDIERRKLEMENLKVLGDHEVRVRVYPGVVAHIKVTVERLISDIELEDMRIAEEENEAARTSAAREAEMGYADGDDYSDDD